MCAELAQFKRPSLLIKSNSRLNNFKRLVLSETDLTLSKIELNIGLELTSNHLNRYLHEDVVCHS